MRNSQNYFKRFRLLYNSYTSCIGGSLASSFLSSFKLTLGNEFPESVIHIEYNR